MKHVLNRAFLGNYDFGMIASLLGLVGLLVGCGSNTDFSMPNVLLIVADDQGYGDVGFHDNEIIDTPVLDRLASESVEFTRFYVSPVCAPTRASLLTGRYHLATGTRWVTHREEVMREEEVTLAELFGAHGYRTGLFGKWHNGKQFPHDPNGQGFQEFFGFTEGHLNNYFDAKQIHNQVVEPTKGYLPDVLTDKALGFMNKEEPFFAMVSFNTPHSPFQVPDTYFDKYKDKGLNDKNASVYGMVENIDDNVGRLLKALQKTGKDKNTIVIFMSDNGPNGIRYNANLKGIKSHVDEGGVRSPFLVRYPNKGWVAKTIDDPIAHIDLLPTLAEVIGLTVPDSIRIHGRSVAPLVQGESLDERFLFTHQVVRKFDTIPAAVRKGNWLLTIKPRDTALFNLEVDPYQKDNLFENKLEKASQFLNAYQIWFAQVNADYNGKTKIQIGHPKISRVEFPAQEAVSYAQTIFRGKEGWANDFFIQWSDSSGASWDFDSKGIESYEVYVEMSGRVKDTGVVNLRMANQSLQGSITATLTKSKIESPDRVPRGEVYAYDWPKVYVGDYRSTDGENTISLSTAGLMNAEIKSIQFILKEEKK